MAVRLSALHASRPLPPGRFLVLISIRGWVNPRAIVQLEGLGKLKNPTLQYSNLRPSSFWHSASTNYAIVYPLMCARGAEILVLKQRVATTGGTEFCNSGRGSPYCWYIKWGKLQPTLSMESDNTCQCVQSHSFKCFCQSWINWNGLLNISSMNNTIICNILRITCIYSNYVYMYLY
jgi:hypothetical protein